MKIAIAVYLHLSLFFFGTFTVHAQNTGQLAVTDDITHFWEAYDRILSTTDSSRQYAYLNDLFIAKGTPGLKALMKLKGYTPQMYMDAIFRYPQFWKSIRGNMLRSAEYSGEISKGIEQLRRIYPALRPAKIYFTIGAFKTGGTTLDSLVLIGSEISMADHQTELAEIGQSMPALADYMKTDPLAILVFTNVHEYVHTQQKTTSANTLLGQCIMEGVAEFVAEKATGKPSTLPGLAYGRDHAAQVRETFAKHLYNTRYGYWLYNNEQNPFGYRDMGYYVGYSICEAFYHRAGDKTKAIRDMIRLDYDDPKALSAFLDRSGYFDRPATRIRKSYEAGRPTVVEILPLKNTGASVDAGITRLTIRFSSPMDKRYRNFNVGPLGEANALKVKEVFGFDETGCLFSIGVALEPGRHYQLIVPDRFRSLEGIPLKPYLIDFKTRAD